MKSCPYCESTDTDLTCRDILDPAKDQFTCLSCRSIFLRYDVDAATVAIGSYVRLIGSDTICKVVAPGTLEDVKTGTLSFDARNVCPGSKSPPVIVEWLGRHPGQTEQD